MHKIFIVKNYFNYERTKIIKNISWLLVEHGVRIVSGIFQAAILARVLGVENYGYYQYILSLIFIFASISYINPAEIMVPKLTNASKTDRKILMGNGFFIRLFFSIVSYLFLIIFVFLSDGELQFKLAVVLGLTILFTEPFGIVTAFLQSQTIIKYRSILTINNSILRIIIILLLYIFDVKYIYIYALVAVFVEILLAVGLIFAYKRINDNLFFCYDFKIAVDLIKQGFPFFVGIVFMCIFWRLDIIMVRYFSDGNTLGLYTSANQLLMNVVAISPIIATSFAPLFIYKFNDIKTVKQNVYKLSMLMFIISVVTVVLMYLLAPFFINIIFGSKFDNATKIFQILLLTLPFRFVNEALNIYIIKMKFGKIMIYKWLIVLAGAIISYIYLIPKYDMIGAASGTGFGYFLACVFGIWVMKGNK